MSLSNALIINYKKGINTLVHAVCGSGKTEIVLGIIKYAIECGEHVGFAVPRRDVCIELYERFSSIFKRNSIALVYGGHHEKLKGDLVCLTTHQLFRYNHYFDLLIVDEIDAFPFKNNEVLEAFFFQSIRKNYVMMSATPDEKVIQKFKEKGHDIVQLFTRFHNHPLPVPNIILRNKISIYFELIKQLKRFEKCKKQVFVFCPTIAICESTYYFIRLLFKSSNYVHSKREKRSEVIQDFRDKKYDFLVTTAVLERGVTVKDLQVIVFKANHKVYDQYSLVQIAGRAGRKKDAPEGEVIFLAEEDTEHIRKAKENIIDSNENLQNLF